MDWNQALFQAHCRELSKALGRQAFWKTALRYIHVRYDDYVEKVKQPGQDGPLDAET